MVKDYQYIARTLWYFGEQNKEALKNPYEGDEKYTYTRQVQDFFIAMLFGYKDLQELQWNPDNFV